MADSPLSQELGALVRRELGSVVGPELNGSSDRHEEIAQDVDDHLGGRALVGKTDDMWPSTKLVDEDEEVLVMKLAKISVHLLEWASHRLVRTERLWRMRRKVACTFLTRFGSIYNLGNHAGPIHRHPGTLVESSGTLVHQEQVLEDVAL